MSVTSTTLSGVNVFQFSGAVTDAEIKAAWASLIVNGTYVLNRAIYLDATADLTAVTGGFMVDFGTQVLPAIILHTSRDKAKSIFNNFIFIQRTGLIVNQRSGFVATTNGTTISNAGSGISTDGLAQNGGAFVYAVPGNPGGSDPRYLNEMAFASTEGVTIMSQEFTEQELQICVGASTAIKGMKYEKAYGFPQIGTPAGSVNVVVYRSTQNTQSLDAGGLIPIRLFPNGNRYASACYVDSYVTRNNADITTRLVNAFGSNASNPACFVVLNNYTRESWFGASKTVIPITSWSAANFVYGGVLKKLQFVNGDGGVVRCYDSRSTTVAQKCKFAETGFFDFTDTNLAPTTDASGKISLVHIGAIASGATAAIARYTGQKYTFQKFGYRVLIGTPDMTSGDNDLSAFTPISLTEQAGISRPLATINAATQINNFQELLEELHVLAIGLSGSQSYAGAFGGNLFNYDGSTLTTSFATVNVDATAASKIAYNSATNTLTIKSSVLSSNSTVSTWENSTGTINTLNGAVIQGVYQDNAGISTVLQITTPSAGYSLCLYKSDGTTKYFGSNLAAGTYTVYFLPTETGTYTFAAEKYGNKRIQEALSIVGGMIGTTLQDSEDIGISVPSQATVAGYTTIDNYDEFYDYTAYKRLEETYIKLGQIATRDGLNLLVSAPYSVKVDQSATSVYALASNIFTIKTNTFANGTKFTNMILVPPATLAPTTTELLTGNWEDANGDSSIDIQGALAPFSIYKFPITTPFPSGSTDDRLDPTFLIATVTDRKYRFINDPAYNYFVWSASKKSGDNIPNISEGQTAFQAMSKGAYNAYCFQGAEIQLVQAPKVDLIYNDVKSVLLDTDAIKGTGFTKDVDSLINISDAIETQGTDLAADLTIINNGVKKASKFIPHNQNL